MSKKVLIYDLTEPIQGTKTATYDFNVGTGNLTIEPLASGAELLASGSLEYLENQAIPTRTMEIGDGRAALALKADGGLKPGFRLPWAACMGETGWQIQLNPVVQSEITARSGGGNVKIDLSGMAITRVLADCGGGNMDLILPAEAANLDARAKSGGGNVSVELGKGMSGNSFVSATSGAGNVTISLPAGIAGLIHISTGMGKVIVDPQFSRLDKNTFRSENYESAANKIEITAKSGAGNVSVIIK